MYSLPFWDVWHRGSAARYWARATWCSRPPRSSPCAARVCAYRPETEWLDRAGRNAGAFRSFRRRDAGTSQVAPVATTKPAKSRAVEAARAGRPWPDYNRACAPDPNHSFRDRHVTRVRPIDSGGGCGTLAGRAASAAAARFGRLPRLVCPCTRYRAYRTPKCSSRFQSANLRFEKSAPSAAQLAACNRARFRSEPFFAWPACHSRWAWPLGPIDSGESAGNGRS
jgi:hypothetical protein